MRLHCILLPLFALSLLVGCGRQPFQARVAPGFVEVKETDPSYDFRAVAPDGVAVAVRAEPLENSPTEVAFWERAVALRMREFEGYALLETREVKTGEGLRARELVFGHDQEGKPFVYRIRLFVANTTLYVLEAGGPKDQMDRFAPSIEWMMSELKVR